jgi:tripartite-type tricarboxylate transporter receptor subunit TctC
MTRAFRKLVVALFSAAVLPAAANAAEDFYAGKVIHLIVSSDATGTYDAYARTMAKHMPRFIPGNPTIIVQNMPGAGGIRAATFMASTAIKDGTYIAATHADIPTSHLSNPKEAQYDPRQFGWIGSVTKELYGGYFWHTAKARTMQDAFTMSPIMGGTSPGSFTIDAAIIANEFFGTKFKIVTGYKSSSENQLAIERGEIDGAMGTTWNNIRARDDGTGKLNVFVQYGLTRNPKIPDIPSYIEFAKNDADRAAVRYLVARLDHGKIYFTPPGVPADRLAVLRKAFDQAVVDPEFLADVKAQKLEMDGPMNGEDLAKLVAEEATTPPEAVQRIQNAIDKFKESTKLNSAK